MQNHFLNMQRVQPPLFDTQKVGLISIGSMGIEKLNRHSNL